MNTSQISLSSTEDVVNAVPYILGFNPSPSEGTGAGSLVVLTFSRQREGSPFHARVDLNLVDPEAMIAPLLDTCAKYDVAEVILLAYTNASRGVVDECMSTVADLISEQGVGIIDNIVVADAPVENPQHLRGLRIFRCVGQRTWDAVTQTDAVPEELRDKAPAASREALREAVRPTGTKTVCLGVHDSASALDELYGFTSKEAEGFLLEWWSREARDMAPGSRGAFWASLMAGFAAWLKGDGATAWIALDQARETKSLATQPLAGILDYLLTQAVDPATWPTFIQEMIQIVEEAQAR